MWPIHETHCSLSDAPRTSAKWLNASGCTQQYKTPYSDLSEFQCRFRVWHFACASHGVDIICCHIAHYYMWEGRDEEREDARRRKQQIASSLVKLDKLTLRDVDFNFVVVLHITHYIQTQLNINHLVLSWLAAMLNYVPGSSMSAVFVHMRTRLFLIKCLESLTVASLTVGSLDSHLGGPSFESLPADQLLWLISLQLHLDKS